MQVVNVFLCRHPNHSAFRFSLSANPLILIGIALELTLMFAIAYTATGQWLFGTAPLAGYVWLWAFAFALLMLGIEELRKICQKTLTKSKINVIS
jgi:sodium/potassium-transporting ATPase subunit alpha